MSASDDIRIIPKSSAVGNRVYTNDVRLRGLRNMEFQSNVRSLTPRYATILQPAEAGFVCIDAVSTAGVCAMDGALLRYNSSTRGGGFCLCRRGFQPPGL